MLKEDQVRAMQDKVLWSMTKELDDQLSRDTTYNAAASFWKSWPFPAGCFVFRCRSRTKNDKHLNIEFRTPEPIVQHFRSSFEV